MSRVTNSLDDIVSCSPVKGVYVTVVSDSEKVLIISARTKTLTPKDLRLSSKPVKISQNFRLNNFGEKDFN